MNSLRKYIKDHDRAEALAAACGTKVVYLRHLAFGHRQASPRLAMQIDEATGGEVSKEILRPDIWAPSQISKAA